MKKPGLGGLLAEAERLEGVYVVSESGLGWTMQNGTEPSRAIK